MSVGGISHPFHGSKVGTGFSIVPATRNWRYLSKILTLLVLSFIFRLDELRYRGINPVLSMIATSKSLMNFGDIMFNGMLRTHRSSKDAERWALMPFRLLISLPISRLLTNFLLCREIPTTDFQTRSYPSTRTRRGAEPMSASTFSKKPVSKTRKNEPSGSGSLADLNEICFNLSFYQCSRFNCSKCGNETSREFVRRMQHPRQS